MANSNPAQYDSIGSYYTDIKSLPVIKYTETAAFQELVMSFLRTQNVRILDLACGTGYYANLLLSWGAAEVTGVDISPAMVEIARAQSETTVLLPGKQLRFEVGDAVDLRFDSMGGPFTMVTGVWLLNYASCKEELVKMFRSISANLDPGGVFIGVVPEPAEDMDEYVRKRQPFFLQNPGLYDLDFEYMQRLESGEGYKVGAKVYLERPFQFQCYHLKQSVYEAAAWEGGMTGKVEWNVIRPSEEGMSLLGEGFWAEYSSWTPKISTLVVRK